MTNDNHLKKMAFAAILYKQPGAKPFEVALSLLPDTSEALMASQQWPNDPEVLEEICRLAGEQSDLENYMPTKEDLCREVWNWVNNSHASIDDRVKAAKLYAELNKMIEKPLPAKPTDSPVTATVMLIKDNGDNLTWEQKLQLQQSKLQEQGLREIEGERVEP